MAESASQAVKKAQKLPVHEVYLDNAWLIKNKNGNFLFVEEPMKGFSDKK